MQPTDAELLTALRAGDREAGNRFVARHTPALWRYASVLTGHDARAEDVLQDTFLAVLRHPESFSGEGSAKGWLVAIARNAWRRQHRKRAGEPSVFDEIDEERPLGELGVEAGWGADPERAAMAAEDSAQLARALAALAPAEREVLHLRDEEGLEGPEVAALLGLSLPAMKSRLHRARLGLMAQLRRGGFDG